MAKKKKKYDHDEDPITSLVGKKKGKKKNKKSDAEKEKKREKRFREIEEKYGVREEELIELSNQLESFVEAVDFITIAHHRDVQIKMDEAIKTAYELVEKIRDGKVEEVWKQKYLNSLSDIIKGDLIE